MSAPLFDVLAINIKTGIIRLLDRGKTYPNAEAIVKMAIMRRGVDEEFYTEVRADVYAEGEKWDGGKKKAEAVPDVTR